MRRLVVAAVKQFQLSAIHLGDAAAAGTAPLVKFLSEESKRIELDCFVGGGLGPHDEDFRRIKGEITTLRESAVQALRREMSRLDLSGAS